MDRRGLNIRKVLLGTVLPLLRRLPPRLASNMVAGIGKTEYRLLRGLQLRIDQAVREGGRHFGRDWDVGQVGRELAGNQIRWRTRDLLLDVPAHRIVPVFRVTGRDHLDASLAEGRGAIILASHYGGHLMPAHWLFRESYPLRFFMERPRHVSKYLMKQFGPLGQEKLFISRKGDPSGSAGSILRASRILKAGMLVYIAGDVRWSGPHAQPARFLGRTFQFSATWANLAAMTRAPVVPVFCQMVPDGTYQIEFRPAFHVPADASKTGETAVLVQSFMSAIEDLVRLYPDNSNEYFFWPEPDDQAA